MTDGAMCVRSRNLRFGIEGGLEAHLRISRSLCVGISLMSLYPENSGSSAWTAIILSSCSPWSCRTRNHPLLRMVQRYIASTFCMMVVLHCTVRLRRHWSRDSTFNSVLANVPGKYQVSDLNIRDQKILLKAIEV